MSRALNFIFYQVGWFACVLGLAWDFQRAGILIAVTLVGIHVGLASDRWVQIRLCLTAMLLGLVVDSLQLAAGVFTFPQGQLVRWLPPPCFPVLWLQFATTLCYCMRWLSGRYVLAAFFGLLLAPMAFFAGERFGAIEFPAPRLLHFAMLGFVWSAVVPLLVFVADRWSPPNRSPPNYRLPGSAS